MYRPLQPPPGYEKYHTKEAVFPGLRYKMKKIRSWSDFKTSFQKAWQLYKHAYSPDPEMQKFEDRLDMMIWKKREETMQGLLKTGEKAAERGVQTAQDAAEGLVAGVQENRPLLEKVAKHRIAVLRTAVTEFAEGYQESVSGKRNFWGQLPYDEDILREDNIPVLYQVERTPE